MDEFELVTPAQDAIIDAFISPAFPVTAPVVRNDELIPRDVRDAMAISWNRGTFEPRKISIYRFDNVYVSGEGIVFDEQYRVFNVSISQQTEQNIGEARHNLDRAIGNGTLARHVGLNVLCYKPGWGNIGHWLLELFPKAHFCSRRLGLDLKFIVPEQTNSISDFYDVSLASIGIGQERLSRYHWQRPAWFESLILVHGLTEHGTYMSPLIFEALDALSEAIPARPSKGLYVTRGPDNWRRFQDELGTCELFQEAGYDVVRPETSNFADAIASFKGAGCVAGLAGAGLARICFCPRDIPVTIFYPQTLPDTFFWFICQHRNLNFTDFRCRQLSPPSSHVAWDSLVHFPESFDPAKFCP